MNIPSSRPFELLESMLNAGSRPSNRPLSSISPIRKRDSPKSCLSLELRALRKSIDWKKTGLSNQPLCVRYLSTTLSFRLSDLRRGFCHLDPKFAGGPEALLPLRSAPDFPRPIGIRRVLRQEILGEMISGEGSLSASILPLVSRRSQEPDPSLRTTQSEISFWAVIE